MIKHHKTSDKKEEIPYFGVEQFYGIRLPVCLPGMIMYLYQRFCGEYCEMEVDHRNWSIPVITEKGKEKLQEERSLAKKVLSNDSIWYSLPGMDGKGGRIHW